MNGSKQEPEVPSKETSGKEVRESYISLFKFESTSFGFQSKFLPKDISSEKLRIDVETAFIRSGNSEKMYNFSLTLQRFQI